MLKPQAAFLQAHPPLLTNHDMVEYVNIQQLAGFDNLPGDVDIFRGGGGVARWVVVSYDDCRRVCEYSRLKALAWMNN